MYLNGMISTNVNSLAH